MSPPPGVLEYRDRGLMFRQGSTTKIIALKDEKTRAVQCKTIYLAFLMFSFACYICMDECRKFCQFFLLFPIFVDACHRLNFCAGSSDVKEQQQPNQQQRRQFLRPRNVSHSARRRCEKLPRHWKKYPSSLASA
jgi:hypothetical protein